jgi:hypothetical protein
VKEPPASNAKMLTQHPRSLIKQLTIARKVLLLGILNNLEASGNKRANSIPTVTPLNKKRSGFSKSVCKTEPVSTVGKAQNIHVRKMDIPKIRNQGCLLMTSILLSSFKANCI